MRDRTDELKQKSDKTGANVTARTHQPESRFANAPHGPIMQFQRSLGNQAVQRLFSSGVIHAKGKSGGIVDMIMMKSHEGTAGKIVNQIRDVWKVDPGNRHEEIIMSDGKSFAGVSLLFLLYNNDAQGAWLDPVNVKKRATLSYDLKAANCDEFADMAYSQGRSENTGAQVGIERQPGHAYAVMFDQEDKNNKPNHTIIDPWIKRAHLRKDNDYYMREGTAIYDETKSDGQGWYMTGYYGQQLKRYKWDEINAYYGRNTQIGKDLAERKKAGQNIEHMY